MGQSFAGGENGYAYPWPWFLSYSLVYGSPYPWAMIEEAGDTGPMGGKGKIIEADETYHGKCETPRKRNKYSRPSYTGWKAGRCSEAYYRRLG